MNFMTAYLALVVSLFFLDYGECFLPFIPVAIGGLAGLGYMTFCKFNECCNEDYIPANFSELDRLLKQNLYGQHLAHKSVLYALRSHFKTKDPKKALAISFHGLPGTGKNYMSDFVVKSLYKNGAKSKYVHYYRGNLDFPSDGLIEQYKSKLRDDVMRYLKDCPRSIFIFDEVEKIPQGTLDSLVPFLDYHPKIGDIEVTQAIFIFLSNTGATSIAKQLLQMWENGMNRENTKLKDFESLIVLSAFNQKGGFHKSDTIESSLIDHYVPFLPLEEVHVRKCIVDAFKRRGVDAPNNNQLEEAMQQLTFGPPPHNIYSNTGCKRIDQKVGTILHSEFHFD